MFSVLHSISLHKDKIANLYLNLNCPVGSSLMKIKSIMRLTTIKIKESGLQIHFHVLVEWKILDFKFRLIIIWAVQKHIE